MKSGIRLAFEVSLILLASAGVASLSPGFLEKSALETEKDVENLARRVGETSLDITKPSQAYPGVTLVATSGSEKAQLVNLDGKIVHEWNLDIQRARLLPNCNLLVIHGSKWGLKQDKWKKLRKKVIEYSWDGEVVWEYDTPSKTHHDVRRNKDGTTIFLRHTGVPERLRSNVKDPVRKTGRILSDSIMEVSRDGTLTWEWFFHEHFDLNRCGPGPCAPHIPSKNDPEIVKFDWTHLNAVSPLPENRWYDAGDERFKPGNVLIMPRNWSTAFLIDRESGDPVWEYRGDYKGGLRGGHEVHMIEKDLPGAGNILIFNNGVKPGLKKARNGSSQIFEINPSTNQLVWVYDAGEEFFSNAAGSVQRLPNGNTLISEDVRGRVFEVTPEKEIVWQYQSSGRTSRAQRFGYDYCPQLSNIS